MRKCYNSLIIVAALLGALLSGPAVLAQDTLWFSDGSQVPGLVLEVGVNEVRYKRTDNPSGPTYSVLKSDLLSISYAAGTKDVFRTTDIPPVPASSGKSTELYDFGVSDAKAHYRGKCGAGSTFWTSTLFTPVVGLIPAISCSANQPKDPNLMYPDIGLMQVPEYATGYKHQAYKMKRGRVWRAWAMGFLTAPLFYVIAGSVLNNN
ncbi:MAG: hypothetical protein IPJ76_08185 [Flavobacteriales bacterium]|nr:MAG: hypothetical protein IPJ76_08185 [Flavobacteriales bacterium]